MRWFAGLWKSHLGFVWVWALVLGACANVTPDGPFGPPGAGETEDLSSNGDGGDGGVASKDLVFVTVRVYYPSATVLATVGGDGISLRGQVEGQTLPMPFSWNQGVKMAEGGKNLYELRLSVEKGRRLSCKPLLGDRLWSLGANYSIEAKAGAELSIYPHFLSKKGRYERRYVAFPSAILKNTRVVWAYLPPSYDENPEARYPVLYMHDGQNLFDPQAAFGGVTWRVAETLDAGNQALEEDRHLPEVLVIGPENAGASRIYEYTPTAGGRGGGGGDLYLRFLIEELKPSIDKDLRTRPSHTLLAGSSLGGLISAYAGLRHPQVFSRIGVFSPSTWWDGRYILSAVRAHGGLRPERVYIDSGDSGPSNDDVDNTRELAGAYRGIGYKDGVDFLYVVQNGGQHNEAYWAQRLPGALHFLLAGYE